MRTTTLLAIAVLAGSPAVAPAQSVFSVTLDGPQAATASPGTGSGTLTLNLNSTISYDIAFSGLLGNTTVSHIHGPAAPGVSAGVVQGLTFVGGPGATSGQLLGTTGALTAQQVTDLFNGLHYVNIHTGFNPAGEIRGQIYLIPEPTTMSLLVLGGMAGLMARRSFRRS